MIAHVSTMIGDTNMEGVLSPGKEAVLGTVDLEGQNLAIEVDVSGTLVTPTQVSVEDQKIVFTAPARAVAGDLTVVVGGTKSMSIPFRVFAQGTPQITKITPDLVSPGDTVTLDGNDLPTMPSEVVFEGRDGPIHVAVSPVGNQVDLTVPALARSGYISLVLGRTTTNALFLSVQRQIDVQVVLPAGLTFAPSDISFPLNGTEYGLDDSYAARIPVDNEHVQIIHSLVDPHTESYDFSYMYSAVILPDDRATVSVDADSTAIAWIFMGTDATATMDPGELSTFYDAVAADTAVTALADYIDTLQTGDFAKWSSREDATLKQKYQTALESVLRSQLSRRATPRTARNATPNPLVHILQTPENDNVYFDTVRNDGSVSLINDTKLYMSVEARAKADGSIVNGYEHVADIIGMLSSKSVVAPKGWGLLGISSEKRLDLNGVDATLEVVAGSYEGETDKKTIAEALRARVFLEGIVTPALNMMISTMMSERIPEDHSAKNIIDGMADIYGAGFLKQVLGQVSDRQSSWAAIADTLVIMPLKAGYEACFQVPVGAACDSTMHGLAKLIGIEGVDNVVNKLLYKVFASAEKRIVKQSLVLVPVVGWVLESAFLVYDSIGYVSDTATIAESIYDMNSTPMEINAEVEFDLEVSEVQPLCVGVGPTDTSVSLDVLGKGLAAQDGTEPYVEVGTAADATQATLALASEDGTQLHAVFTAADLVDEGSWEDSLFVGYDGSYWVMYDVPIRIVDQTDDVVYFDAIEPERGHPGATVELKGCGWIPLDGIAVYFQGETGEVPAEIVSTSIDTIEVEVPLTAVSGPVHVVTGTKRTRSLYFGIDPFNLTGSDPETVAGGSSVLLEGNELAEVSHVYFTDRSGATVEGGIVYSSVDSVRVQVPDALGYGELRVYAVNQSGVASNELALSMVPQTVDASPLGQSFEGSIEVTLTQSDGVDIFYRVDDGSELPYGGPITLDATDARYEYFTLYAYARVQLDGVPFPSPVLEYRYTPCASDEVLEGDACVPNTPPTGEPTPCPMTYDPDLDTDGDFLYWINPRNENSFGWPADGTYCQYYASGPLMSEQFYVSGDSFGTSTTYFESGQAQTVTPYLDGLPDGTVLEYRESGMLTVETQYVAGVKNGYDRFYWDNGQLWEEHNYLNGLQHGRQVRYTSSGELIFCNIYENGSFLESCSP